VVSFFARRAVSEVLMRLLLLLLVMVVMVMVS